MTVFLTWPFTATGAITKRTLPNRLADEVNVRDYGAMGDGSDQTAALQLAINAAFGSAGSPHGTSATLNRVLRIPNGEYGISSPLIFTDVVGGQILGSGPASTTFQGTGSTSIMTFNGCENTYISGFRTHCGGRSSSSGFHGILLDAGVGAVGLSGVTVAFVNADSAQYGVRVAPGGTGGSNITLLCLQSTETHVGVTLESPDCMVNAIGGSFLNVTTTGFWVQEGSLNCNMQMARTTSTGFDILHESTGVSTFYGIRSESLNCVKATDGTVVMIGVTHQGNPGPSIDVTSPAVVRATSCAFGDPGNPTGGYITGTGDVFLRNIVFGNGDPIFLSSFTGQVCECLTEKIFTFAQLPSAAADGLLLNMSNANTSGWAMNITGSGGNAVLTRWNGANWTVVGK